MGIFDNLKKKNKRPKTALQRKKETEKLLKKLDIPFIENLPLIEEENEVKIRNADEIATRILILTYLNYVLEVPEEKNEVISFLKTNDLWNQISSEEKSLLDKEELTQQERINISWRSEAIWLLLWTIKKVDKLELPIGQVDVQEIVTRLPDYLENPIEFLENAEIRSTSEILDMSDITYRLHWATRNADLNGKQMPANLDSSVVVERHYAINWVTYYNDDWDEITTDT